MKRTNLLKAVVCGMMITLIMTSTVFAGTKSVSEKVRGRSYTNNYEGEVGYYVAAGDSAYARTTIVNRSTGEKWFQAYVYRYNYNSMSYDDQNSESKVMTNGVTMTIDISRAKSSSVYDYIHLAKGFYTSVYINGAVADEYRFEAQQYYRE